MWKETEFRRAQFRPGLTVQLADGQSWVLPDQSCPEITSVEYGMLREGLWEAENETDFQRVALALLIYLLDFNYRLSPAEFSAILDCPVAGDRLERLREATRVVAISHLSSADHVRYPAAAARRSWANSFCLGSLFPLKWGPTRGT